MEIKPSRKEVKQSLAEVLKEERKSIPRMEHYTLKQLAEITETRGTTTRWHLD